jgi:hypothetical protein
VVNGARGSGTYYCVCLLVRLWNISGSETIDGLLVNLANITARSHARFPVNDISTVTDSTGLAQLDVPPGLEEIVSTVVIRQIYPNCPMLNRDSYDMFEEPSLLVRQAISQGLGNEESRFSNSIRKLVLERTVTLRNNAKKSIENQIKRKWIMPRPHFISLNMRLTSKWYLIFEGHWYDKNLPEITGLTLGRLRRGNFNDADEDIKELWIVICTRVIPNGVCKAYKRVNVRKSTSMHEIVSVSMEALVFWFLQVCYSDWVKEWKQAEEDKLNNTEVMTKSKPKGTNFATLHGETYEKILDDLTKKHATPNVRTWDMAILDRMNKPRSGAKRGLEGGKAPVSKRQPIFHPFRANIADVVAL